MAPQVPTAITKVMPAWQSASGLTKYIYRKSISCFGQFQHGTPCWDAALDATVLAWDHASTSKACEVRHITVSFPDSVSEEEALRRLPKIVADWIARYAPDRDWVAGIHADNGKYHVHIAVANVKDGKALRLMPHQVVEMSRMGFTQEARDAKGVGSTGLHFYTKAKKPLLADVIRTAPKEQLNEWLEAGRLRVGRRDKKGVVTSIEFDPGDGKKPRRIRLETIQRLAARRAAEAGEAAAAPIADTLRAILPAAADPTSKKLDAAFLVTLNPKEIHALIEQGKIQPGRFNKQGNLVSITLDGRRVRLSTLQRFALGGEAKLPGDRSTAATPPPVRANEARARRHSHPDRGVRRRRRARQGQGQVDSSIAARPSRGARTRPPLPTLAAPPPVEGIAGAPAHDHARQQRSR